MVKGFRYFIFLSMVLLLVFAVPAFAALPPGTVDQSQLYHESGQIVKNHNFWVAQTFTAGDFANPDSRQLVNVELMLEGNGDPVKVQIRDWTGSNMGNMLGETTIPKVKWCNYYKASFPGVRINSGQTYAIVVSSKKTCLVHGTITGDYTNGDAYYSNNSGKKWKLLKSSKGKSLSKINDFYFKTYVACLESYEDAHLNPVCNLFTSEKNTVYIGGSGLEKNTGYSVAYYDGEGNKKATDNKNSDGSGGISSSYLLNSQDAIPGTWHAVVYKEGAGVPAPSYNPTDAKIVLQDEFEVDTGAIPEFPAVVSSIMVVGICAGIYSRIKKRKLSMAG